MFLVELAGKAQVAFSGMDEGCLQRRGGQGRRSRREARWSVAEEP